MLLLCSCAENDNADVTTTSYTTTVTSAASTQAEIIVKPDPFSALAEYKSDNIMMSALSDIAAEQVGKNVPAEQLLYAHFDWDCDYTPELFAAAPHDGGYCLYCFDGDNVFTFPLPEYDRIILESCCDDVGNPFLLLTAVSGNIRYDYWFDSGFDMISSYSGEGVSESEADFKYKNYLEMCSGTRLSDMSEYLDDPAALESHIADLTARTPLDNAYSIYEKCQDYGTALLYDFTGDGFPELFWATEGVEYEFSIYDISCEEKRHLFSGGLNDRDMRIYICRDGEKRYIVWKEDFGSDMDVLDFGAYRADINEYGGFDTTELGYGIVYYATDRSGNCRHYNPTLFMEGAQLNSLGMYEHNDDGDKAAAAFDKAFTEYISQQDVIDEIIISYIEGEGYVCETRESAAEFVQYPAESKRGEHHVREYEDIIIIIIAGTKYRSDSGYVYVNADNYPDFDTDMLNKFPKLNGVSFGGTGDNKVLIKSGEWCERVTCLTIDPACVEFAEDFEGFPNVTTAVLTNGGDLSIIPRYCPNTEEIVPCFLVESKAELEPLTKLKDLRLIRDSGHGSCLEKIPWEDWQEYFDMFPDSLWVMIK